LLTGAVISLAEHFVSGDLSTELFRNGTDEVPSTSITPTPRHKVKTAVFHSPNHLSRAPDGIVTTSEPPAGPDVVLQVSVKEQGDPSSEELLAALPGREDRDAHRAAPLLGGLSVEVLRSRLAGEKVK
jgi:hypothetical protein